MKLSKCKNSPKSKCYMKSTDMKGANITGANRAGDVISDDQARGDPTSKRQPHYL